MSRLTVTIELDVPDGVEVADVRVESRTADAVEDRIALAPKEHQSRLRQFVRRLETLGCSIEVPAARRSDYLNVRHPDCRSRVASFSVRPGYSSGERSNAPRVEVYCDPKYVKSHPPAQANLHNGEPVHPKIYLFNAKAVDAAVDLVAISIDEKARSSRS